MRASQLLPLVIALLLSFVIAQPLFAQQQEGDERTGRVTFTIEQNDFSATITPLRSDQPVEDFYNYSNFQPNTGLEESGLSQIFLYENTNTGNVSLVMLHNGGDGESGTVAFSFSQLPEDVEFLVQDDSDDEWTMDPPTAEVDWTWQSGFGDGGVIGPLPRRFNLRISPDFEAGIEEWAVLSGDIDDPNLRTIPNMSDPIRIRSRVGTPPTASFRLSPSQPTLGSQVTFDASGSSAAEAKTIERYEWDFNGDGTFEVTTAEPTVTHTFEETGTFRVRLRVTDSEGLRARTTQTVEVAEIRSQATRTISTPEAADGFTFRVTIEIELGTNVNGLGLNEDLPPGFEVTPVENAGATFKRAETQWVWPSTVQANEVRRVVYDVTVSSETNVGELPQTFAINGFLESASPAFKVDTRGQSEIRLVDCLSIPVSVAHLTPDGVVDLRSDNTITDDQLQRAVSFWLEDAPVPGTCNALVNWEMMKTLIAHQLDGVPINQAIDAEQRQGATVTRTIRSPLPASQIYLPNESGRRFRVQLDIRVERELSGFGLKEVLPSNWTVRAIQNDGAVFKRDTREWVFPDRLTPEFDGRKQIVYEVTVPEGESTGFARIQGKGQAIRPQFERPTEGDLEVELVECLDVPAAVAHLAVAENAIRVGKSNLIEFDQIQAAIAFWLEEVSVPGTCGKTVGFETIKALIAHWLTDTPINESLPGGASVPSS